MGSDAHALTRRGVFDRIPRLYLGHYRRAYAAIERRAASLGLAADDLSRFHRSAPLLEANAIVSEDLLRRYAPYDARGQWRASWEAAAGAGLAEQVPGGWRLAAGGREVIGAVDGDWSSYIEARPSPEPAASRLARTMGALGASPGADDWRASMFARRIAREPKPRSGLARAIAAIRVVLGRRDDCHFAAWRAAGFEGPVLDALSAVWSGVATVADTQRALARGQDAAEVERSLAALIREGAITREGDVLALTAAGRAARDAIETETDRRFFGGWPEGEALAELDQDLSTVELSDVVERLGVQRDQVRAMFSSPADAALAHHASHGEWCAKQDLGHLIEAEGEVFLTIIPGLLGRDQTAWWERIPNMRREECDLPVEPLVERWLDLRERGLELARSIAYTDLGRHDDRNWHHGPGETVGDLIRHWPEHTDAHLAQAEAALAAAGGARS